MPPRVQPQAPFKTRLWNFVQQRKVDIFFASVALFALGTVVRRELMVKGVVKAPANEQAKNIMPRVERTFGKKSQESSS